MQIIFCTDIILINNIYLLYLTKNKNNLKLNLNKSILLNGRKSNSKAQPYT